MYSPTPMILAIGICTSLPLSEVTKRAALPSKAKAISFAFPTFLPVVSITILSLISSFFRNLGADTRPLEASNDIYPFFPGYSSCCRPQEGQTVRPAGILLPQKPQKLDSYFSTSFGSV